MIDLSKPDEGDGNVVSSHRILPLLIALTLTIFNWIRLDGEENFSKRIEQEMCLRL